MKIGSLIFEKEKDEDKLCIITENSCDTSFEYIDRQQANNIVEFIYNSFDVKCPYCFDTEWKFINDVIGCIPCPNCQGEK